MPALTNDLWSLVIGPPQIDPNDLAAAIERESKEEELDYRTRLLLRDSLDALRTHWGTERLAHWLAHCPTRQRLENIGHEVFERPGFTLIGRRLMEKTKPDTIRELLRELGTHIPHPLRLNIGGSAALILPGYLERHTEDIDVVDEVPKGIREQHALLEDLKHRYGLLVTHFGAHYLPTGWPNRLHYLEVFGDLRVYLVDALDIFLGKLFSNRTKDLDDLRMLILQLDKETLTQRLRDTTAAFQSDPHLLSMAKKNWYILFGEALPQ